MSRRVMFPRQERLELASYPSALASVGGVGWLRPPLCRIPPNGEEVMRPTNLRSILKILLPGSMHLTRLACVLTLQCDHCSTPWTTEADAQGLLPCGWNPCGNCGGKGGAR
jgi:hypothetical protein